MTVKDDYFKAHQDTLDVYDRLLTLIKEHKEYALEQGISYGHIGDMNKIQEDINSLISFLV